MAKYIANDISTLLQVMTCCHRVTDHYLNWCRPRFMSPYGAVRSQWLALITCFIANKRGAISYSLGYDKGTVILCYIAHLKRKHGLLINVWCNIVVQDANKLCFHAWVSGRRREGRAYPFHILKWANWPLSKEERNYADTRLNTQIGWSKQHKDKMMNDENAVVRSSCTNIWAYFYLYRYPMDHAQSVENT